MYNSSLCLLVLGILRPTLVTRRFELKLSSSLHAAYRQQKPLFSKRPKRFFKSDKPFFLKRTNRFLKTNKPLLLKRTNPLFLKRNQSFFSKRTIRLFKGPPPPILPCVVAVVVGVSRYHASLLLHCVVSLSV